VSQQINLYNPAFEKQKKLFTANAMLVSLGVLLCGALALAAYGRHAVRALDAEVTAGAARLEQKKQRQASALVEFAPRRSDARVAAALVAADAEQAGLREVLSLLQDGSLGNTAGYSAYFKALARQSSASLWLTGVMLDGAGAQMGLQGRALQAQLVPAYITRLTHEPVLRGKTFGSLQINGAPGAAPVPGQPAAVAAPYLEFSLQASAAASDGAPAPTTAAAPGLPESHR
jgi:hypothetical protein